MSTLHVAALQLPLGSSDEQENIRAVSALVEQAAAGGAQVILPPELFSGPYFCKVEDEALFALARPTAEHPSVQAMQALAAKHLALNKPDLAIVRWSRLMPIAAKHFASIAPTGQYMNQISKHSMVGLTRE